MKLNKNISFVLIHLLAGVNTAAKIGQKMPEINIRSIQRALNRLTDEGVIKRKGVTDPVYTVNYDKAIQQQVDVKLLENTERPNSTFNFTFLDWLVGLTSTELEDSLVNGLKLENKGQIGKKELEHLTIELSWKSSALEGNTYTLLDTQLLIQDGIKADNKTSFETQMILNHKNAITFIVDNPILFSRKVIFSTVEELHRIIGHNLDIESGVRKRIVRISSSNYEPISNPHKIREHADSILGLISSQEDPFIRSLLSLSLMPYLQPFEDGNKRTGRMLANAMLIHSIGRGFSLRNVNAKQLALAYLSFYEFNSLAALQDILNNELS